MGKLRDTSELEELREAIVKRYSQFKKTIVLCGGTGCRAYGSEALRDAFQEELQRNNLDDRVRLMFSGCHGFCERGPLVVIRPEGILYCGAKEPGPYPCRPKSLKPYR